MRMREMEMREWVRWWVVMRNECIGLSVEFIAEKTTSMLAEHGLGWEVIED